MFTNINITNTEEQFKYVVEYKKTDQIIKHDFTNGFVINSTNETVDDIFFGPTNYIKQGSYWYDFRPCSNQSMMGTCGIIRLYFPQFSVDTYHSGHKYSFEVCTWIRGKRIVLGSHIINRNDTLMCPSCKKFFNESYYECIDINIVDPYDLIYSDSWSQWRKTFCGEISEMPNSEGSILYCSLHPIQESNDGEYLKLDGYIGGQSHINLTSSSNDYLHLEIKSNIKTPLKKSDVPSILFDLKFNKHYNGSLEDYLLETYDISNCKIKYELIVGSSNIEEVYAMCTSPTLSLVSEYVFTKNDINKDAFENGCGWKEGIVLAGSVEIMDEEENPILYILSNQIPFSEDLLRYFIKTDFVDKHNYIVNNVNLDKVDMEVLNLNIVNKTENKIITSDKPFVDKSGSPQFVFYRVVDLPSINIRPNVNENICINLDQYKHLVKSFILQVEGIKFIEIGRTKSGVVFKIIGGKLPKSISSGQYYVLNQDSDLVTSGKYTYEV